MKYICLKCKQIWTKSVVVLNGGVCPDSRCNGKCIPIEKDKQK